MLDRGLIWTDPGSDNEKPEIVVAGKFDVVGPKAAMMLVGLGVCFCVGRIMTAIHASGRCLAPCWPATVSKYAVPFDGGLYVTGTKARNLLTTFLTGVRIDQRARAVSTTGWHGCSIRAA